jgi:DNA/RNA endonuclease G (NUC1)
MYDELTFRYYNCVPQTKELNRGIWKQQETTIRAMSQTDSLLIFCFNDFSSCNKPQNSLHVPTHCVKGVKSLSTGKWVSIMLYTNTSKPEGKQITPEEFKAKFGIDINQY